MLAGFWERDPVSSVAIAAAAFVLYLVAYHTYGRYLARRVFRIEPDRLAPSRELEDGVDYVPSRRELVFGHHFTSIAGTGPIVGPAVAVIWGWVPALIWVLVGSIVMGAVHDFGSIIISMRHRGRTIADLAGDVVSPRVRVLFLVVVLVGLWIVLAVFGLVIAIIFSVYPSAVVPSVLQIPIALALGLWLRRGGSLLVGTVVAICLMYASIAMSASVDWATAADPEGVVIPPAALVAQASPVAIWTILLLAYAFVASVLPMHTLLQPRDYINAHQLLLAMGLLVVGLLVARPQIVADAVNLRPAPASPTALAPAFLPFLFVTIACGAISGFHCLVASGCSSRQLQSEADAQYVGFGAMLAEGFLATLVILACIAGIGLGTTTAAGSAATGREAWLVHYAVWGGDSGLASVLQPFVTGSANLIEAIGISHALGVAIMGVFVASFAATTLDSATRLQRYIIAELATGGRRWRATALANRHVAAGIAVISAAGLALSDALAVDPETGRLVGLAGAGKGGLVLWPMFGATNQLLGGLALLVITVWLVRQRRPAWVTALPMVFMLAMTGWAIVELIRAFSSGDGGKPLLLAIAIGMLAMEIWIAAEAFILLARSRGTVTDAAAA
jgi:carbon starvation protein